MAEAAQPEGRWMNLRQELEKGSLACKARDSLTLRSPALVKGRRAARHQSSARCSLIVPGGILASGDLLKLSPSTKHDGLAGSHIAEPPEGRRLRRRRREEGLEGLRALAGGREGSKRYRDFRTGKGPSVRIV